MPTEMSKVGKRGAVVIPASLRRRFGIKEGELARALAMKPQILLLDELCAGMNLEETVDIARFVLDIHEEWDTTIILIEHDMGVVMDISDRVCVLDFGIKIAEDTPLKIRHNEQVIQAYLGEQDTTYSRLQA